MTLQEQLKQRIRVQGKSPKTFQTYWKWIHSFLLFAREKRGEWVHPKDMGERQVEIWLTHLANVSRISENTQNVALQAVCYLYREILNRPLQVLLGHSDIRTTEIYVHADQHGATAAKSPLESLLKNPAFHQPKPQLRKYG